MVAQEREERACPKCDGPEDIPLVTILCNMYRNKWVVNKFQRLSNCRDLLVAFTYVVQVKEIPVRIGCIVVGRIPCLCFKFHCYTSTAHGG